VTPFTTVINKENITVKLEVTYAIILFKGINIALLLKMAILFLVQDLHEFLFRFKDFIQHRWYFQKAVEKKCHIYHITFSTF